MRQWLKGLYHKTNNFLKVLKVKLVLLIDPPMVLKICFGALLWSNKLKFLYASMKTLTNFEDPYWNPLQIACCGIQEAAWYFVNCSISRRWCWKIKKKIWRVGYSFTFRNHRRILGNRLFQRMNWGPPFSLRSHHA